MIIYYVRAPISPHKCFFERNPPITPFPIREPCIPHRPRDRCVFAAVTDRSPIHHQSPLILQSFEPCPARALKLLLLLWRCLFLNGLSTAADVPLVVTTATLLSHLATDITSPRHASTKFGSKSGIATCQVQSCSVGHLTWAIHLGGWHLRRRRRRWRSGRVVVGVGRWL